MKLHHKVISLPIMVLMVIFVLGLLSVEYQVKFTLQKKFEQGLQTLSSFALSSLKSSDLHFNGHEINPAFDSLADSIAKASKARISFISYDGILLGDSALTYKDILITRKNINHKNQPEIALAITNNIGIAHRFSPTQKRELVYFARFDIDSGYIARIALPENAYGQIIADIRWGFSAIIFVTILAVIIFGFIALKLIKKAVNDERKYLENQIISRTKELTLIQTMTTMINNAESVVEASVVLSNILPKLLPGYSGALYITKPPLKELEKVVQWGKNWPSGSRVFIPKKETITSFDLACTPIGCIESQCHGCDNFFQHCYGVNLTVNQYNFGKIYFINQQQTLTTNIKNLIKQLVEPINSAISNVQLKNQLQDQAIRDPLTGLYNRRYMMETLEKTIHRADRQQSNVAVLMIDLDHFKDFNDKFGHQAGDLVLVQVSENFKDNLRLEDIACRYGGEEFCLICPDTTLRDAFILAEKLREKIGKLSIQYQHTKLDTITMSIGIAIYPNHANNGDNLIIKADQALYLAKDNGRNCTIVFQPDNNPIQKTN